MKGPTKKFVAGGGGIYFWSKDHVLLSRHFSQYLALALCAKTCRSKDLWMRNWGWDHDPEYLLPGLLS